MKANKNSAAYIVVIGASAGGFNTIMQLAAAINPDDDAAYFVVLHLARQANGRELVARLQKKTRLTCVLASDHAEILRGHLYFALPNHHLIVRDNEIRLGFGATENRWRPSIDVLFRTAAASFTTRVIGIVLTGMLNDGTTGMSAIKRSGGTSLVQDPAEAEYPDMPLSVIQHVPVDFTAYLDQMPGILHDLTGKPPKAAIEPPADIVVETDIELNMLSSIPTALSIGELTPYTCPDCGGVLFKHDQDAILRFKCHTGHSYSLQDLSLKQAEEFESSLWYAIRSLEQKKYLYNSLHEKYKQSGPYQLADDYKNSERDIERHIEVLKEVLVRHKQIREPG